MIVTSNKTLIRANKAEVLISSAEKFVFGLFDDGRPISYYHFEVIKDISGGYKAIWLGLIYVLKTGLMAYRDNIGEKNTFVFDSPEDAIEAAIKAFSSLTLCDTNIITFFTLNIDDTLRFFRYLDGLALDLGLTPSGVSKEGFLLEFQRFADTRMPLKPANRDS
jgi:hypothetical protein